MKPEPSPDFGGLIGCGGKIDFLFAISSAIPALDMPRELGEPKDLGKDLVTTEEVSEVAGVGRPSLHEWLRSRKGKNLAKMRKK